MLRKVQQLQKELDQAQSALQKKGGEITTTQQNQESQIYMLKGQLREMEQTNLQLRQELKQVSEVQVQGLRIELEQKKHQQKELGDKLNELS